MKSLICLTLINIPICLFAEGGLPTQPYIYVVGEAEVEKAADMVTLSFSIVANNTEQAGANKEVQATAAKIFALLDTSKIPEKDVIASDLKSQVEYEEVENSHKRGKLIGYSATRPFTVKVRDISVFPKLVDGLLAVGGLEFSGIEAGLSNRKDAEEQIWEKALANARERTEKTLKAANMKIDSTFAISPVMFPAIPENIFGSAAPMLSLNRDLVTKNVDAAQYRLAPISISRSVHVIYLISPAK